MMGVASTRFETETAVRADQRRVYASSRVAEKRGLAGLCALSFNGGKAFMAERERHVAFIEAVEKAIPFPGINDAGAGALAWHAEQGHTNCGIALSALAAWLRQAETHYKALSTAREALKEAK